MPWAKNPHPEPRTWVITLSSHSSPGRRIHHHHHLRFTHEETEAQEAGPGSLRSWALLSRCASVSPVSGEDAKDFFFFFWRGEGRRWRISWNWLFGFCCGLPIFLIAHFHEMEQSTTLWKLSGGLSPASSASELGLQKEGWAASHILHHEMVGWSQPCLKLYTVPTQTFPCMHGTSFSRHATVIHKSDSSLYPALMLQTWKNKSVLELPETRKEAFSVERCGGSRCKQ